MTEQQHDPEMPRPREPVIWGCAQHRTPAGQPCPGCADQGELFTRAAAGTTTYRPRRTAR